MLARHRNIRLFALAPLLAFAAIAAGGLDAGLLSARLLALAAGLMPAVGLLTAERSPRQLNLVAGSVTALLLGLVAALRYTAAVGVGLAILTVLLAAIAWGLSVNPHPSRLAMFRSQWQVPLYAALATWVFLAHRGAALLAGIALLYTAFFVVRRHQHRPLLLVLAGVAILLFGTQVALGAQAALQAVTPLTSLAHLLTATAFMGVLILLAVLGYYAPSLPAIAGAEVDLLPAVRPFRQVVRDYYLLTKPRILLLLLITGFCGMWVAAGGMPNLALTLVTMLGLGMSCGAANAINMWYDEDIDQIMNRTRKRPIPDGRVTAQQALAFGIIMGALSYLLLAVAVNLLTAALSLAGLLFYVCIYTMWLKRSTAQNIVIGGAAGSIPPLVGWAAVTGEVGWAAVIMFLIVFIWTPPHFWALALFRGEDYARAGVPMLPVVKGELHTKWQILVYSILLIPTGALLYYTGVVGVIYLWVSIFLGLTMVAASVALLRERLPTLTWAHRTFGWSLLYLAFIFIAMTLDVVRA